MPPITSTGSPRLGSARRNVDKKTGLASAPSVAALSVGREEASARGDLITAEVIARPDANAAPLMPHATAPDAPAGADNRALGLVETRGMVPLIQGVDAMAKAASVDLIGWAFIGGALVHALVRGDVASVHTAVEAGARGAEEAGDLHATLVIPNPAPGVERLFPPVSDPGSGPTGALGVVETTGYVGAISAADGAIKAADVEILSLTIGSGGRVATLFKGDLAGQKL